MRPHASQKKMLLQLAELCMSMGGKHRKSGAHERPMGYWRPSSWYGVGRKFAGTCCSVPTYPVTLFVLHPEPKALSSPSRILNTESLCLSPVGPPSQGLFPSVLARGHTSQDPYSAGHRDHAAALMRTELPSACDL